MKLFIRFSLFIILIVLGFHYLTTTTELAKKGEEFSVLKREIDELEKENRAMTVRLGSLESLLSIEEEAKRQGLVDGAHIVYLPIPPSSLAVSKR